MTDTHPEISERFERLMRMKTNEERLLMGLSMYDTAREIVKASILKQYPHISSRDMKRQIRKKFYVQNT